jgi:type IV pilus assembly protein PilA
MKKFNKDQIQRLVKGFTLIELLVVIAIIGILSSVVLSSLNTARDKGKNAAAKSELGSVRAQASIYYDENSQSFGVDGTSCSNDPSVFSDSAGNSISALVAAAEGHTGGSGTAVCANDSEAYVVALPLIGGDNWCVDSTGYAGTTTLAITGSPSDLQNALACQ